MKLLFVAIGLLLSFSAFSADEDFPFWVMQKGKECLDKCQEEKDSKIRSCIDRAKTCAKPELAKIECEAGKTRIDYFACRKRCLDMINDIGMRDWCTRHGLPVQECWPDDK